ncbi:hypothetical protein [Novipirellula caenicola]|uniref:Uncharacterized protein n=1 Tax=Novipirellula caenicola TaxID=1536901 RepID=A0ABP9W2K3_9BACT
MGAWQYSVNLLPANGVIRVHGRIPPSITVPRVTPESIANIDVVCDARPNYWLRLPDSLGVDLVAQLEKWLTETESWSPNARMFGDDDTHDQLSIWRDDNGNLERINMLFSLSNPAPNNLTQLLSMPSLHECLFHGIQSEAVYVPTLDNWIADMHNCSAARYLRGREYPVPREGG